MVTIKRVPDLHEQKNALAMKEEKKQKYEFKQPVDHQFKNYDTLAFMQKDFNLKNTQDEYENKHGLTVFDKRPKEYWDWVEKHLERDKETAATSGKAQFKSSFQPPRSDVPVSQNLHDYHATKKQGKKETS